ncbi:MAG: NUDIX domain-containing protein [Sellimonas intestinalis]
MMGNGFSVSTGSGETYEVPGGHREAGETIDETARRELYEETGATDFDLFPVCVYSVAAAYDNGKRKKKRWGCSTRRK